MTDLTGAVIGSSSSKTFVADRKKRFAPHIIDLIVKRLSVVLKVYRIDAIRLFLKMSKYFFVNSAIRALRANGIRLVTIMDLVPIAHNGCRKKKARRL